MTKHSFVPNFGTVAGAIILLGLIVALIVGLVLAGPAHGAGLSQMGAGDITGQVTLAGQVAPDVTVELHKRSNGGEDALLTTAKTDGSGTYHFTGQASAPNDAFYYVRFLGGTERRDAALSAWYSFPIIYIMGSDVSVPAPELSDVGLVEPAQNAAVQLPVTLKWKSRKMGETYRVFVYQDGKTDKPVLDSGSLGTGTEFAVTEGSLLDGKYEALVQVRDTVVGYGQSQSRFHFTVGAAAQAKQGETAPTQAGAPVAPANPSAQSGSTQPVQQAPQAKDQTEGQAKQDNAAQPDIKLNLSSDKTGVKPGESMTYRLEVENAGTGAANGLVVTDKLPAGVSLSTDGVKSSAGKVSADVAGGIVTVHVESLAPGSKATIEIPVSVKPEAGSNLSNQASAQYDGSQGNVQSNAYIAQVAAPLTGSPQNGSVKVPPANPPVLKPPQPTGSQPQEPNAAPKANPETAPPAKAPAVPPAKKQSASVPQTGGSFPILLALVLLIITLLARYLRGLKLSKS